MRVAFDVTPFLTGRTGVTRYLDELTQALERSGVRVDRFAFGGGGLALPPGTRHLRVPSRVVYPAWRRLGQPSVRWLAPEADLVHGAARVLPPARVPVVVTVHDLDALDHPHLHPAHSVRALRGLVSSLDRAAVVIAVSRHVASALSARGADPARIAVIHHGVPRLPDPVDPRADRDFFLAVGGLMPRKGFDVLVRGFARAVLGGLDTHDLVIAGPAGIQSDALGRLVLRLGLGRRVRFAGPVGDAELAGLYRAATALCVPSLAEGFGLPVLEAMAVGTPVAASDLPVFHEVGGGHALSVPAGDEREWGSALLRLAGEASLRAELASAGRPWAARFTWDRAAAQTIDAYRRALVAAA